WAGTMPRWAAASRPLNFPPGSSCAANATHLATSIRVTMFTSARLRFTAPRTDDKELFPRLEVSALRQQRAHIIQLVTQQGGLLKFQVLGGRTHACLQFADQPFHLLARHFLVSGGLVLALGLSHGIDPDLVSQVTHGLDDAHRLNAMGG